MSSILPDTPAFETPVYGTVFAHRCDFDLATFPSIRAWLKRVEQTPGFVSMDWQPGTEAEPEPRLAAGV